MARRRDPGVSLASKGLRRRWWPVLLLLLALPVVVAVLGARLVARATPWGGPAVPVPRRPLLVETPCGRFVDFDGEGRGGLIRGRDWLPAWRASWVRPLSRVHPAGRSPSLLFASREAEPLVLDLRLQAQEPQSFSPVLNGRTLPAVSVDGRVQDLAVPLPAEALVPGVNELVLEFERAVARNPDGPRWERVPISALFHALAVRCPDDASSYDPRTGTIDLRPASTVALPYSTLSVEGVELSVLEAADGASLRLTAWPAGGARRDLGARDLVAGAVVGLPVPSGELGRLEIELAGGGGASLRIVTEAGAAPAPSRPRDPVRPHVFIYVVDTLRADAVVLGDDTGAPAHTPALASFARESLVFDRAWSPAPWTYPSTLSLLAGRYRLPSALPTERGEPLPMLGDLLAGEGYDTFGFSQSYVVSKPRIIAGFETFLTADALSRGRGESHAVPWFLWHHLLGRPRPERPLFAYFHTVDPHGPYTPRGPDRRFVPWWRGWRSVERSPNLARDRGRGFDLDTLHGLYLGEAAQADRGFGAFVDLLRFAGLYDESLIVVLSDHGEEFGEHGGVGHGRTVYEELLRVPLLVHLPGGRFGGRRIGERVSTVDVVPTVLELLGLPTPPGIDGRSLLAPVRGDGGSRVVRAYQRPSRSGSEKAAVAEEGEKCLAESVDGEVVHLVSFDLASDPAETRPLERPAAICRFLAGGASSPGAADGLLEGGAGDAGREDEVRRLEALGYL